MPLSKGIFRPCSTTEPMDRNEDDGEGRSCSTGVSTSVDPDAVTEHDNPTFAPPVCSAAPSRNSRFCSLDVPAQNSTCCKNSTNSPRQLQNGRHGAANCCSAWTSIDIFFDLATAQQRPLRQVGHRPRYPRFTPDSSWSPGC